MTKDYRVKPGKKIRLADFDTDPPFASTKQEASVALAKSVHDLADLQDKFFASNTWSMLVIFQAMDAAGKDGAIKHVMSGLNPQGCQVFSFKAPSAEELDHDFLWRAARALPERGRIGIFNRSYYEEVLVVKVHPEFLDRQQLPPDTRVKKIWKRRYDQINNFEKHLVENGTQVVKFFLNVSKAEQKRRFLERIEEPEKNWKFSPADVKERGHWDAYMEAYEDCLRATSTAHAPWYVIPADRKSLARLAVAQVLIERLEALKPDYPVITEEQRKALAESKAALLAEDDADKIGKP